MTSLKTSYWARHLPPDHVHIGISRGSPRWMKPQPRLAELQPGSWLYTTDDPEEYRIKYVSQLACVDVGETLELIDQLAGGRIPVLACFCKPGGSNWCHRAWISVWLAHRAGLDVTELGMEAEGAGSAHPLLPQEYRRPLQVTVAPERPLQLPLL